MRIFLKGLVRPGPFSWNAAPDLLRAGVEEGTRVLPQWRHSRLEIPLSSVWCGEQSSFLHRPESCRCQPSHGCTGEWQHRQA